jgi:hypothetical protein
MPDDNETQQSDSYPLYDLQEAIKIAETVRDLGGGNSGVARSLLAKELKYAETGPSFFQRVSASKAFGLIDGRGSYSLTDIARQYFFPVVENGQQAAAVRILSTPKAFSVLVQKFDGGKLPAIETIGNIVHTDAGIPVSKKNTIAGCFIRSAQFIGAIDSGGFLRCKALVAAGKKAMEAIDAGRVPKEFNLDNAPDDLVSAHNAPPASPGTHTYVLPLDKQNQRKITVNAPLDMTPQEVLRVTKWLKVSLLIEPVDDNEPGE